MVYLLVSTGLASLIVGAIARSWWTLAVALVTYFHVMTQVAGLSEEWGGLVARTAGLAIAAVSAIALQSKEKRGRAIRSFFMPSVLLLMVAGTASLAWTANVIDTLAKISGFGVLVFWVYVAQTRRWSRDRGLLLSDLSTMVRVLGITILFSYLLSSVGGFEPLSESGRYQGVFKNPNTLGVLAMSAALPSFFVAYNRKSLRAYVTSLLFLIPLLQSGSRGSLFALTVACVFGFLIWTIRRPRPIQGMILLVIVCLISFRSALQRVIEQADSPLLLPLQRTIAGTEQDDPFNSRLIGWADGYEAFLSSPWIGHGWNATRTVMSTMFEDGATVFEQSQAHNSYLEILIDLGVLGGLICLCFLGAVLLRSWRISRRLENIPLVMSVLAGLIVSLSESFMFGLSSIGAWLLWTLMFACFSPSLLEDGGVNGIESRRSLRHGSPIGSRS